jgi:hypothetical protein
MAKAFGSRQADAQHGFVPRRTCGIATHPAWISLPFAKPIHSAPTVFKSAFSATFPPPD